MTRTHVHPTRPDAATTHVYNGDGVLMRSITAGVTTTDTHDLARSLPVLIGRKVGNAEREWYAYLPGSLLRLGQHAPDGTLIAHLHDFQHSLRATLDAQGRTQSSAYTAFGVPLSYALHPVFGFAGELHDPLTGLVYLRARWYDPDSGTLLTTDPYHGGWQQPYGHHPYQYAYSNPLRFADPSGEIVIVPFLAILAVSASAYGIGSYAYVEAQKHDNQWAATGLDLVFGYGATQEAVRAWQDPDCSTGERAWKTFWGGAAMVGGITAMMPVAGAVGGMGKAAWAAKFGAKASAIDTGVGTMSDVMRAVRNGGDGLAEMRRLTGDPTLELIQGGLGDGARGYFNAQENAIYYAGTHPDPALIAHELTHKLQSMRGGVTEGFRRMATVLPSGIGDLRTARAWGNIGRATLGLGVPHVYFLNPVELEATANALFHAFGWNRVTLTNFGSPTVGYTIFRWEVMKGQELQESLMGQPEQDGDDLVPTGSGSRPTRTGR